jgi:hypothetical protein
MMDDKYGTDNHESPSSKEVAAQNYQYEYPSNKKLSLQGSLTTKFTA